MQVQVCRAIESIVASALSSAKGITIDTPTLKPTWLARFSELLLSGTHRLVRNVKIHMRSDELLIQGRTDSYHAVQVAISTINALIISQHLTQRVRLELRVNGWPLEIVIANPTRAPDNVTRGRRCEQTSTP